MEQRPKYHLYLHVTMRSCNSDPLDYQHRQRLASRWKSGQLLLKRACDLFTSKHGDTAFARLHDGMEEGGEIILMFHRYEVVSTIH